MSREERRAQLIEVGRRQVERSSFDELSTDDVAAAAGISRGLLFHYFPTRDDFMLAVAEDAAGELVAVIDADPDLPPFARLRAALAAYVDHVTDHRGTYLALIRGAAGGSAQMQRVFERTRGTLAERILRGLDLRPEEAPRPVRYVARGYVGFAEEVVVTWLRDEDGGVSRQELIDLLEASAAEMLEAVGISPAEDPAV